MARVEAAVRSRQLIAAARDVLSREGVARTPLRFASFECSGYGRTCARRNGACFSLLRPAGLR